MGNPGLVHGGGFLFDWWCCVLLFFWGGVYVYKYIFVCVHPRLVGEFCVCVVIRARL